MLYYILIISIIAFFITVIDKHNAKVGKWRVRENTLLLVAIFGGSVAMYFTMRIIRHKTLHNKFMIGLPFIFFLQILLFVLIYQYSSKIF